MSKTIKPILSVVTSNSVKGSTGQPTGYWLSELIHPLDQFEKNGISYEVISIKGGEPPIDPVSLDLNDPINAKFMNDEAFKERMKTTRSIDEVLSLNYSAIFFAGGHGPLWDIPNNPIVHKLIREFYENGDIVAAVCHGPCALINVQLSNLDYLIKDKKLTAFSNAEEIEVNQTEVVPFALETSLSNHHADFQQAPIWNNNVIVDGNLITGQNPQSAASIGEAIAKALIAKNA